MLVTTRFVSAALLAWLLTPSAAAYAEPVGSPPAGRADGYTFVRPGPLHVAAPGVLANDGDPDRDAIHVVDVSYREDGPGNLQLETSGELTYRVTGERYPAGSTESFTYRVEDASGNRSEPVTVTIQLRNQDPSAGEDAYMTDRDAHLEVGGPGVLGNDGDPEADGVEVTSRDVDTPHGRAVFAADGGLRYSPDRGFTGRDSFGYTLTDEHGAAVPGTVSVVVRVPGTVTGFTAADDAFATPRDATLAVERPGVLRNDVGAQHAVAVVRGPANGRLTFSPDGGFRYTPRLGFTGIDSFEYAGGEPQDKATATIRVLAPGEVLSDHDLDQAGSRHGDADGGKGRARQAATDSRGRPPIGPLGLWALGVFGVVALTVGVGGLILLHRRPRRTSS